MGISRDTEESDRIVGGSPLLARARDALRFKHYSIRTEVAYLVWIKRYILFHGKRHPEEVGEAEVESFLNHLAVQGNVAASTQNQALNALVFLYRHVVVQKALKAAMREGGIHKRGSTHTLRHNPESLIMPSRPVRAVELLA